MDFPAQNRWTIGLLIVGVACVGVLGFLFGRDSAPTRVEERVRIQKVEVEKQVVVVQEKLKVERVVVETTAQKVHASSTEVVHPDGRIERTHVEDTVSASKVASAEQTRQESNSHVSKVEFSAAQLNQAKVVERDDPRWRLGASAGLGLADLARPIYGGEVGMRVIGPVWLGAYGRSDGTAGITVAIEF